MRDVTPDSVVCEVAGCDIGAQGSNGRGPFGWYRREAGELGLDLIRHSKLLPFGVYRGYGR